MPEKIPANAFFLTRWKIFFTLAAAEALGALGWLVSIPGESGSAVIWGLSAARLVLAALPLVVLAGSLVVLVILFSDRSTDEGLRRQIKKLEATSSLPVLAAWLGGLVVCIFVNLPAGVSSQAVERIIPIVGLSALIFFELAACLAFARGEFSPEKKIPWKRMAFAACLAGGLALLAGLNHLLARGIDLPFRYMNHAGAPLLPGQVYTALFVGASLQIASGIKPRFSLKPVFVDAGLCLLTAFIAAALWLQTPPVQTNFSHLTGLPNLAYAPFSDARLYDLNAQALLAGEGLGFGKQIPRPLYSAFLALLHALVGQDYLALSRAQILALALFPVLIYLLGAKLGSRAAGFTAALLVIFREMNQSLLSAHVTLSSVRVLMTETFTAGLLVLFCILAVRWLAQRMTPAAALLAGAGLGLSALARSQALVILPAALLVCALVYRRKPGQGAVAGLVFLLGAALVLLPWMTRNAVAGGAFTPENTGSGGVGSAVAEITAGTETATNPGRPLLLAMTQKTALHIQADLASTFAQLPYRLAGAAPLEDYYQPEPFSNLNATEAVWAALNLLVLAAGVMGAYQYAGWGGLIPLVVYSVYALSGSLLNFSGWRFIQPVDWTAPLYFSLGVIWLVNQGVSQPKPVEFAGRQPRETRTGNLLATGLTLAAALLLPFGERLVIPRMPEETPAALSAQLLAAADQTEDPAKIQALESFTGSGEANVFSGRGFYPDFLETSDDTAKSENYLPLNGLGPGLAFNAVADPVNGGLVFLSLAEPVRHFPNGANVITAGCRDEGYFHAYALLVRDSPPVFYLADEIPAGCTLP